MEEFLDSVPYARRLLPLVAVVGVLYLLKTLLLAAWFVACGVRTHFLHALLPYTDFKQRFGKWAVVTGCTDGIGRAYACELAKRGLNIVLISRSKAKLEKTASEIEVIYHVETKIIVADFSEGHGVYGKIRDELRGTPVGILVNNVGYLTAYPKFVDEVTEKEVWNIININIGATVEMTRMVLPQMKKLKKGAIVNVSSLSEVSPVPLLTVYGASKAFMKYFTEGLRYENRGSGVVIQRLNPGFVATNMTKFSNSLQRGGVASPDAWTYARHAVNTLGVADNTTGYWFHALQKWLIQLCPYRLRTFYLERNTLSLREEHLRGSK